MKKTSGPRRWPLWVLLGALFLAGSFFLDAAVQGWITLHQTPPGLRFMGRVSWWGDWPLHVIIALIGVAIAYALGSRRWIMICAAMVIACALAGLVNRTIKIATGRARPLVTQDAGWNGLRFDSKYTSFPSGHTAATTAFFGTLVCARRRVGLVLLPIPLLIAVSRIYLNAHYLSDVVGGALVGMLAAFVTWRFFSTRMLDSRSTRTGVVG